MKKEKCERLYKLKKENSVRGEVSRIILKESSSRGGASRKIATGHEPWSKYCGKKKGCIRVGLEMVQAMAINHPKASGGGGKT